MDVGSAWESRRFDELLLLLEEDEEFPKNFDVSLLSENNEHERRLIEFTKKRNKVHLFIEEDNLGELKLLISNDKSKLYLNDKNQSAVFTAIKNKKFEIYAFLIYKSAGFKDENEELIFNTLNMPEKSTIESALVRYFPSTPKAHIYYLVSKSKPKSSSDKSEDFEKKVQRYYETLGSIREIKKILQVIQYADYLDIIFDFDNDNVSNLCPNDSKNTKGKTAYKDGRIYIAAGKKRSEEEILGTIAHELTHMAMQLLYQNNCNPYYKHGYNNGLIKKSEFEKITKTFSRNTNLREKCRQRDTSSAILFSTFSAYGERDYHSELIVRVPQILAQYQELGREWLMKEACNLFDYFKDVMKDCQNFIDKSYILKPRKQIRWINETVGQIKKIRKFPLCFRDFCKIKTFLERENNEKTFLVAGKSRRLCVLKILQSVYGKDYINSCDQYLVLKFQNFVKEAVEIVQNFKAEGSDTLIIEYSVRDHSSAKLQQQALTRLVQLQDGKQNKKIIFTVNQKEEQELKDILQERWLLFDYFSDTCQSLCDLDDHSQNQIFKKKIRLQNKEFELKNLIKDDTIKSLIDGKIIDELISDHKIEIENKVGGLASLDGAYANLQEEVNTNILANELINSENTIFVFEGCKDIEDLKKIIEKSSSLNIKTLQEKLLNLKERNRLKMVKNNYHVDKFKEICQRNPNKDIYWIKINNEKEETLLFLRKLYTPKFYTDRNFVMYEKIIIDCEKVGELNKFEDVKILISNTNSESFTNLQTHLIERKNRKTQGTIFSNTGKLEELSESIDLQMSTSKTEHIVIGSHNFEKFRKPYESAHKTIIKTIEEFILGAEQKSAEKNNRNDNNKETGYHKFKKMLDTSKIIFTETEGEAQKIFDESIKLGNIIYWLKKEGDNLSYYDSHGQLKHLRTCIDMKNSKQCKVSETEFIERMKYKKAIIIADDPGMGKSTTITKLMENKAMSDDHWIIKVNLKEFLQQMNIPDKTADVTDVVKSNLVRCLLSQLNPKSGKKLIKVFLELATYENLPISLLLLFDAFDEVLDKKKRDKIISLLKFLKEKTKIKFWITTRLHCKNELEDSLSTFALEFEPMDEPAKTEFVKKYLNIRLNLTLEKTMFEQNSFSFYAMKFLDKMRSIFKEDLARFIGTPLQLHLMLEDAVGKFRDWINQQQNHDPDFSYFGNNLSQVYENFINKKYDYFKEMKKEGNEYSLDEIKSICDTSHMKLAKILTLKSEPNVNVGNFESPGVALACGIVRCQNGNLEFIHATFQEYYAAKLFINWFEKEKRLSSNQKLNFIFKNVLVKPDYRFIRSFLNDMFVEIKTKISSKNLKYLKENINESYKTNKPSHIIISNTLIQEELTNIFKFLITIIEKENFQNIRCRFNDPLLIYCCRCNRKSLVECILEECDRGLKSDGFLKLLSIRGRSNETCLHHAAFYNNVEIIKLMLDKATEKCSSEEIYTFLAMKDAHENTWLHLSASCLGQFFSVIYQELDRYYFRSLYLVPFSIIYKNKYGFTFPELPYEWWFKTIDQVLWLLADNNDSTILSFSLIFIRNDFPHLTLNASNVFKLLSEKIPENKVDCFIRGKNLSGCNALHFAAANGDCDLVQMILERYKKNPPEYAAHEASIFQYKYLISADNKKNNAIHYAVYKNQNEVLQLLLNAIPTEKLYEVLLLSDNYHGYNILHYSVMYGNVWILEKLHKMPADKIDQLYEALLLGGDDHGLNIFHFSALKEAVCMTNSILEKLHKMPVDKIRSMLFSKSKGGWNALHIAVKLNNISVVESLLRFAKEKSLEWQNEYLVSTNLQECNAIHISVLNNYEETAKLTLDLVPSEKVYETLILTTDGGYNILHLSAMNGNVNITNWILEKLHKLPLDKIRSILFSKTKEGWNALHLAVEKNNTSVVELLLQYAKENLLECQYEYLVSTNLHEFNAIHISILIDHEKTARLMIDLVPSEKVYQTFLLATDGGYNIFHLSAMNGNVNITNWILEKLHKLSLDKIRQMLFSEDNEGCNALHCAVAQNNISVVELLLQYATEKSLEWQYEYLVSTGPQKRNAIHISVLNDHEKIARLMLDLVPSEKVYETFLLADDDGYNIFHLSAWKGNVNVTNCILEKLHELPLDKIREMLFSKDKYGGNAIHCAVERNNILVVELLLQYAKEKSLEWQYEYLVSADIKKQNAIHISVLNNYDETAKLMLGLVPSEKVYETLILSDDNGYNILHLSALKGNVVITKSILEKLKTLPLESIRLVLFYKEKKGLNALHLANIKKKMFIVDLLLRYTKEKSIEWET